MHYHCLPNDHSLSQTVQNNSQFVYFGNSKSLLRLEMGKGIGTLCYIQLTHSL